MQPHRSSLRLWKLVAAVALLGLALWMGPPEARAEAGKPLPDAGVNLAG